MNGYTLEVIQKLGEDFYSENEEWIINPTSDFWQKVSYGKTYEYPPATLADMIKDEKEEKKQESCNKEHDNRRNWA